VLFLINSPYLKIQSKFFLEFLVLKNNFNNTKIISAIILNEKEIKSPNQPRADCSPFGASISLGPWAEMAEMLSLFLFFPSFSFQPNLPHWAGPTTPWAEMAEMLSLFLFFSFPFELHVTNS